MKYAAALITVFGAAIFLHAQAPARGQAPTGGQGPATPKPLTGVVFFDKDKVAAALAKGGNLVTAPDLIVLGSHRAVAGRVEVHEKETDVMYVIEGAATFVTGGKMEGGKLDRPDQWFGRSITGGDTHRLAKGDIIIVPAGTPHWFKEVTPQISYYVVKVVKP